MKAGASGSAARSGAAYPADAARELEAALSASLAGDVRFDRVSRILYSTDASNYQIEPLGVVVPRHADDVAATVSICSAHGLPVVPRAGGTSLGGQSIGPGIVMDFSVHMDAVEVDAERRRAHVGPGAVLERLNRAALRHGLTFGPDPASADRACMGGLIGNNGTGARSIVYGMAVDHLLKAEAVLADGSPVILTPVDFAAARDLPVSNGLEQRILASLAQLVDSSAHHVLEHFPRYWRRAGGYNLDRLVSRAHEDGVIDPCVLLAGSEGSLAVATGLTVRLVTVPAHRALLVIHFGDPLAPFRAVPHLLESNPSAVELMDRRLITLARQAPGYSADAAGILGDPQAVLIVEHGADSRAAVLNALDASGRALRAAGFHGEQVRAVQPEDQEKVWRTRKAGLGLLMRMRGDWKPVPGIEDTAVPPAALYAYIKELRGLLAECGVEAAYYAHASVGCIHVRPILNLKTSDGVATLEHLAEAAGALAAEFGGVQSSEHGDGLARGALNRQAFGATVYSLFERVKTIFDPQGILNPGKVVGCARPSENLRYGPTYSARAHDACFAYPDDGDIQRAIEQCNGAGVCRKLNLGTMCPSFMVTREEEHSTRGRANVLRAVVDGRLPVEGLAADEAWRVMELCVGCKACQAECPSGVDMARLKIEVTAARRKARGTPLRSRLFASLHRVDRRLEPMAAVLHAPLAAPLATLAYTLAARRLGLSPDLRPPSLARQSFDRWWRHRLRRRVGRTSKLAAPTVVLFADTLTTFHHPAVGRAAVAVLEAAGFRVLVPPRRCCGRPALSQGLVAAAVRDMRANCANLAPLARRGIPIVVPEPSCASAFRDEMPDLLAGGPQHEDGRVVAAAVSTLDEFVASLPDGALALKPLRGTALLHTHCHQRARAGVEPGIRALQRIPGLTVQETEAGCCGMAGAFGYEAEHRAISTAMAEQRLVPAIRAAPAGAVIVASGASCRQQIRATTSRRASHPIELLARCLAAAP